MEKRTLARGKKRGPKPFRVTAAKRQLVMLYKAGGLSEPTIALEIGCAQNTLRKHFKAELRIGAERQVAKNLRRLNKAADAGNVTAMKHLDAKFRLVAIDDDLVDSPPKIARVPRTEAPGKKEVAQREAEAAVAAPDSEWGSDLDPTAHRPH